MRWRGRRCSVNRHSVCHELQVAEGVIVVTAKEKAGGSGRAEAGEAQNDKRVGELSEALHRVVSRLALAMRRLDSSQAATGDLTSAQLSILLTLLDRGPIRMNHLAARERARTPTTTIAVQRLESRGLVTRYPDTADKRGVLVDITPRGLAVHRDSVASRRTALAAMLGNLNDSELSTLTQALAPLEHLLDRDCI
jgi:DNA-binding MarR family transcriptional regulator